VAWDWDDTRKFLALEGVSRVVSASCGAVKTAAAAAGRGRPRPDHRRRHGRRLVGRPVVEPTEAMRNFPGYGGVAPLAMVWVAAMTLTNDDSRHRDEEPKFHDQGDGGAGSTGPGAGAAPAGDHGDEVVQRGR
jgi:hypothetical protein